MIEKCCAPQIGNESNPSEDSNIFCSSSESLIQRGDRDESLVYFLAFKLHCAKGETDEAIEMFEQMQEVLLL